MAVKPAGSKLECFGWLSYWIHLVADRGSENVLGCWIVPSCATVQWFRIKPTTRTPWAGKTDEVARLTHYNVFTCGMWINGDSRCCRTILESELKPCLWSVVKRLDAYDFLCNCKRRLGGLHGVPIHVCNGGTSSIRSECQQNADDTSRRWNRLESKHKLQLYSDSSKRLRQYEYYKQDY